MSNEELAEELHKPIMKNFKKQKVELPYIDNNLGADLADMQLISKFNKNLFFRKYPWIIPLKDRKGTTITNPF